MNPNQIRGEIRFTNREAAILDILQMEGFVASNLAQIRAESVDRALAIESMSTPSVRDALVAEYEVTVESGQAGAGIAYHLMASMQLDANTNTYLFGATISQEVEEEPARDVELDLEECAGIIDLSWLDRAGQPRSVINGSVKALRETAPGSEIFERQAFGVLDYLHQSRERLVVRGDGARYQLEARYSVQMADEPVTLVCQASTTVACDEIAEVICEVPDIEQLGRIVGQIDILGEDERGQTSVRSLAGPFNNSRRALLTSPLGQQTFALEGLLPSELVEPAAGFGVETRIYLRQEQRYQFLVLPTLGLGQNPPIAIAPGQTVDLGTTLVVDPGYLHGSVWLQGPTNQSSDSCLSDLYRLPDDPSALPASPVLDGSSYIEAVGKDELVPGASSSAVGGLARTLFAGEFNLSTGAFEGDYDLVLGGLQGDDTLWTQRDLILRFLDPKTDENDFQDSRLTLQNRITASEPVWIRSGSSVERSIQVCFNEVSVRYSSRSGRFFRPSLSAKGRFTGLDFQGDEADYYVALQQATVAGTPIDKAAANDRGQLNLCLPQGSYEMRPFVNAVDPSGGFSLIELPAFELQAGCGQRIELGTDLQLALDPLPACTDQPIQLEGQVSGNREIASIKALIDDVPSALLCADCGIDPTFASALEAQACEQWITVLAEDVEGGRASVSQQVRFDDRAPELTGCQDLSLQVDRGARGMKVFYDVEAADNCDGGVVAHCDHASGSFFEMGSTTVACESTDRCGRVSRCEFRVDLSECRPDRVYGVHDEGLSDSQLFRLDLETGDTAVLGPLRPGSDLESLEVHPQTGELYTVAARSGELYRVDKRNGDLTLIGVIPNVRKHREIASLAFHPDGTLWAYHKNIGLVTLSLEDASAERQWYHPTSSTINRRWDALAWDPVGRFLWGMEQRELFRWDPKNRQVERICGVDFLPGKTEALDFSPEGVMLAGWHEPTDSSLNILVIDPTACTVAPSRFDIPFSDIESLAWESCR